MHPLVNHLIQLQELAHIREEQKVAVGSHVLDDLDKSIKEMTDKLPNDTRQLFNKLLKKDRNVIVPISNAGCAVCGMKLPISLVQAVRLGKELHLCPNCARVLYYPEIALRRVDKARRRMEPQKVGISRFSSHTLMIPRLTARTKPEVIRELAFKMEDAGFVDRADILVDEALRREAILSTAVEHGLAFPHVRGVEGGGLTLALGISPKGVSFTNHSRKLTHIVFFLVIPTAASAFYLKLLAGLTETFMDPEARKKLMKEDDPDKLWKILARTTRAHIK